MENNKHLKFIIELQKNLTEDMVLDLLISAAKRYKESHNELNRRMIIDTCGLTMFKFIGEDPKKLMESFDHFKSFEDLHNIINPK